MKNVHPILLFREMVWESQNRRPSRLLGLQIGATHVGVAVSNVKGPVDLHCVLERKKSNIMASKFRNLIRELSVGGIVVGVPFDIREKNPGKNLYEVFVDELNKAKKLEEVHYVIWDDSWSGSQTVNCLLDPFPLDSEVKKILRDEEIHRCATGILQSYLDYGRMFVPEDALKKCDCDT